MREDDRARGLALCDTFFDKIKGSTSMAFDIRYYRSLREGHHDKTYEYLMEMMARTIATERDEKNRLDRPGVSESHWELSRHFLLRRPPKKDDEKLDKKDGPLLLLRPYSPNQTPRLIWREEVREKRRVEKERISIRGIEPDHQAKTAEQEGASITLRKEDA